MGVDVATRYIAIIIGLYVAIVANRPFVNFTANGSRFVGRQPISSNIFFLIFFNVCLSCLLKYFCHVWIQVNPACHTTCLQTLRRPTPNQVLYEHITQVISPSSGHFKESP